MGQSASREDSQLEGIIRVLLMGKTGHGKSATGNFLLNRKVFETSSNMTSQTKNVNVGHARFKNFVLTVVDGPGLEDTDIDKVSNKAAAEKNMDKALAMCSTGVDAFLFVIKFGVKFTPEEVSVLETLKALFGDGYFNHVIVVVTFGDLYGKAMAEETCSSSFQEWCSAQTGEFKQLFEDSSGRVVLFNNTEKNEKKRQAQIEQLAQLTLHLKARHGRYNSNCFEIAKAAREKLILEQNAHILKEEIQVDISLLTADIEQFSKHPSSRSRNNIRKSINDLRHEIQIQDKVYGVLADLLTLVEDVENNLTDSIELQRLARELETIRKAEESWSLIESIFRFSKNVFSCMSPVNRQK